MSPPFLHQSASSSAAGQTRPEAEAAPRPGNFLRYCPFHSSSFPPSSEARDSDRLPTRILDGPVLVHEISGPRRWIDSDEGVGVVLHGSTIQRQGVPPPILLLSFSRQQEFQLESGESTDSFFFPHGPATSLTSATFEGRQKWRLSKRM